VRAAVCASYGPPEVIRVEDIPSPPIAAGQVAPPPTNPTPGNEATGAGSPTAAPTEAAGTQAPSNPTPPPKPEEAVVKAEAGKGAKAEAPAAPTPRRRRERAAAAASAGAATEKPAEAAGEKKPAGQENEAKAGETPKTEAPKPTEAAKPAQGENAEKAEKTEKPAEAAKAAEAPPVATDRPTLKITSSPAGADVVIDGVPVGTTPFSSRDVSADGTHAISVKKDGYEPHERMISGSDWARGKGGAQSLKFNVKLKRSGGEQKPAEAGEKKEKPPEVEILTPSEP